MPGVIAASESAWTYGGAILTFVFPMVLFLTVAVGLYVMYTKPSTVPGHREQTVARPIGWTPVARMPRHDGPPGPQYVLPRRDNPAARGESPEGAE